MSKHIHEWEFLQTTYQYPVGYTGTAMPVEYAYFVCALCERVEKRQVTTVLEMGNVIKLKPTVTGAEQ